MLNRRDLMRSAATAVVAGTASGQEPAGPFDKPTAKFNKAAQDKLPKWAFRDPLKIPLVARPSAIGTYEELMKEGATPFGETDPIPIGEVYHGIAREWGETPEHWRSFGCNPSWVGSQAWNDKCKNFGTVPSHRKGEPDLGNWGGLPIKCYKIPIVEAEFQLGHVAPFPARMYTFAGMVPGPSLKMRLGQPVIVRFQNHLEAEVSVHLHGAHSPSHSDGFPSFYVLQGKSRDYFYPNILPLKKACKEEPRKTEKGYVTDVGESQSTMWYHDHAMDATGYNVSKGLAGFAPCLGEHELKLIHDGILPGLGPDSCRDPELCRLVTDPKRVAELEDPDHPGFYRYGKEPYHNPYDIPIVLQDKVIDPETGQIAFETAGHNGYLGDTFFLNGVAWPYLNVENRKYRFRFLDGSNARIYRLRFLAEDDYFRMQAQGVDPAGEDENAADVIRRRPHRYDEVAKPFLRIGKDSWLWSKAVEKSSVVLAMANRADLVVDFKKLAPHLKPGEEACFYLVNTMPQFDGRGPKVKLDDGGDPRVLPLPFDTATTPVAELNRPIGLMKIVVQGPPVERDACVEKDTELNPHEAIRDDEVEVVREFIFQRGKGAWMVNGRFYDPTIANATPTLGSAEEWVLRNGGGGWWHPIHIHLESHQLISYEKDFEADAIIDPQDPPAPPPPGPLTQVADQMGEVELRGLHDTQVLGPNTVARLRMRFRTWSGPFVFHCHNLEHEDMRMMHNFEPVPRCEESHESRLEAKKAANIAPDARTHGNDVTLQPRGNEGELRVGELPWEYPAVPTTPVRDAGEDQISPRRPPKS
ncbi:putative multicopper oxidase [Singulisphaera acidiphila DSM 18658]|uniref:Putative multicopper oxidase n=2 Tax=Singulisphaera acidiphila TaxID=466153 RepID=L0D784_SINAD|nr:putative multicopper oxidase [Singulisphaera acidiphila DSM 18658]